MTTLLMVSAGPDDEWSLEKLKNLLTIIGDDVKALKTKIEDSNT